MDETQVSSLSLIVVKGDWPSLLGSNMLLSTGKIVCV